jgi:hypothetical protein
MHFEATERKQAVTDGQTSTSGERRIFKYSENGEGVLRVSIDCCTGPEP